MVNRNRMQQKTAPEIWLHADADLTDRPRAARFGCRPTGAAEIRRQACTHVLQQML